MFDKILSCTTVPIAKDHESWPLCADNLADEAVFCENDASRREIWRQVLQGISFTLDTVDPEQIVLDLPNGDEKKIQSICAALNWLGENTATQTTGQSQPAGQALLNVMISEGAEICTQQNYGKLKINDDQSGWAWEICPILFRYTRAREAFFSSSRQYHSLWDDLSLGSTINPRDILHIQRALFSEFRVLRESDDDDAFDADDNNQQLEMGALGQPSFSRSQFSDETVWFTFAEEASNLVGSIAEATQSVAASKAAVRHRYAAGMYRARDKSRDVMNGGLTQGLAVDQIGEAIQKMLDYRTIVHLSLRARQDVRAIQPTALSAGADPYLFRTRESSQRGGTAVRLAKKKCECSKHCDCGAPGLPELLENIGNLTSDRYEAKVDAIVLVSIRSLDQYQVPSYKTIMDKNPKQVAA